MPLLSSIQPVKFEKMMLEISILDVPLNEPTDHETLGKCTVSWEDIVTVISAVLIDIWTTASSFDVEVLETNVRYDAPKDSSAYFGC